MLKSRKSRTRHANARGEAPILGAVIRISQALSASLLAAVLWQDSIAQQPGAASGPTDQQLVEIGLEFQDGLNFADDAALVGLYDFEAFGLRMAAAFVEDESERVTMARGIAQGDALQNLVDQHINLVQGFGGYATFLRVQSIDGLRGPLLRLDLGDNGFNYFLLVVEDRPDAGPRVVDLYIGTNGELLSKSAGAIAQLLISPSPTLLGQLFGRNVVNSEFVETFRTIGAYQRNGQYAEAYDLISTLPEAMRNHRILAAVSVQLAGVIGGEVYEDELTRLASLHGDDPGFAFLLLDHYFLQGDFVSAMASAETLERVFGFDAAIGLMKTSIASSAGDVEAALEYAGQAAAAEPDDENSHWALVTAYLGAGQHADVVDALVSLEDGFGYIFDATSFAGQEIYQRFVDSPEYEAWIAGR